MEITINRLSDNYKALLNSKYNIDLGEVKRIQIDKEDIIFHYPLFERRLIGGLGELEYIKGLVEV